MSRKLDALTPQMKTLLVQWARSKNIKAPSTAEGMDLLVTQFQTELASRAQTVVGAAGDATYASDPIARQDPHLHLVRDSGAMIDVTEPYDGPPDDFHELVRDRNRALEMAGGDDLAAEIIYRDQGRHEEAQQPQTRNPLSAEGSVLGSSAQVPSGTTASNAPTVANWADKDSRSRMIACAFAMVPVSPAFGAFSVKPFGIVQFGTAAYSAQFEVDIGTGCIFSVPASQVLLSVGNDAAVAPDNASVLQLSGMISFDPIAKSTPLTRTVYIDALGAGASSGGIAIKPFAKKVWFWRAPVAEAVTIEFHNSSLGLLYSYVLAANTVMTDPIPLANDVTNIVINDTGGGGVTHGRLIFELGI